MNYDGAVAYLDRHIELGWKPGLERIHRLLEMMGSPHLRSPAIHVTGTNGKTTVTTVAASVLDAMGLKSGTFTSPHLERVEERFKVAGEMATPEQLARAVTDVAPFVDLLEAETGERATYFELTTAAAFTLFANEAVDVAVVEVGMGGRLDATNVLESQVAVLTGVSMDHAEYLGTTELEIAREKLAILKAGGVLVTGDLPDEVDPAADRRADEVGAVRRTVDRDFRIEDLRMSVGGWSYDLDGIYEQYDDLYLPLHGRHQAGNAAVAVAAVEELFGRALPSEAVREGLARTRVPARVEVVGRAPLVVLDGAHNPEATGALARTLREEMPAAGWTLVVGAFRDKDIHAMLAPFAGLAGQAIATAVDHERAAEPSDLVVALERVLPDIPVTWVRPVSAAVELAKEWSGGEGAVLVTGSFYVAGEARTVLVASC
ncbi:MAG: bifunctional folylpolyglutamate synthase/dihydrofolate synthase [bacterium]|nr:bifunctional folylpolyglutamate synthase/dihydrofolate synthase [bacterium]MDE0374587.1 bifunctional folylpolyglutamate synthase/dihydrofolate synthase [bacterium]